MMTIHELRSDDEIKTAFPLMRALRDRLEAETFVHEVRRQQALGYELIGAFADGRLVALAGVSARTRWPVASTSSWTTW